MLRSRAVLASAVLSLTLGTGASASDLDTKGDFLDQGYVFEDDSRLVFRGPGLEAGFRMFIQSKFPGGHVQSMGAYGPAEGRRPRAELFMRELGPRFSFTQRIHSRELQEEMAALIGEELRLIRSGSYTNRLGPGNHTIFRTDEEQCLVFIQYWNRDGANRIVKNPKTVNGALKGFYCVDVQVPLIPDNVVRTIGNRLYAMPDMPEGWLKREAAAEAAKKARGNPTSIDELFGTKPATAGKARPAKRVPAPSVGTACMTDLAEEDGDLISVGLSLSWKSDAVPRAHGGRPWPWRMCGSLFITKGEKKGYLDFQPTRSDGNAQCQGEMTFDQPIVAWQPGVKRSGSWEIRCSGSKLYGKFERLTLPGGWVKGSGAAQRVVMNIDPRGQGRKRR